MPPMRSSYIGPIEVILYPVNRFRTQGVLEGLYSTADCRNPKVSLNFDVNVNGSDLAYGLLDRKRDTIPMLFSAEFFVFAIVVQSAFLIGLKTPHHHKDDPSGCAAPTETWPSQKFLWP